MIAFLLALGTYFYRKIPLFPVLNCIVPETCLFWGLLMVFFLCMKCLIFTWYILSGENFRLCTLPLLTPFMFIVSISNQTVTSICINKSGEWLALGCASLGQLVVWEWQSESFVLKQQGHYYDMNVVAFSPDGQWITTGGDGGKVKLWDTVSGFCFVTFHKHTAAVTGVTFGNSGQFVLSSSLDGTVRAFDLNRYCIGRSSQCNSGMV